MKTNSVVVIKRQEEEKVSEETVGLHIGEGKLSGDYLLPYFKNLSTENAEISRGDM